MNKSKLWLLTKAALPGFLGLRAKPPKKAASAPLLGQGGSRFPGRREKGRGAGKFLLIVLGVYFLGLSLMYSVMIAQLMLSTGGDLSAVPAVMMVGSSLLVLITGIASGGKALFQYRDYDMVMSLPVSVPTVAASRLLLLYLYELLYAVLLMLPAGGVYFWYARPGLWFLPVYLLCMLLTPLLPLIVSAVLGTFITALTSRFKRLGTLMNILFTLVFLALVFLFSFTMGSSGDDAIAAGLANFGELMAGRWPPARLFLRAVCDGNVLSLLLFTALSAGPFALFCLLIARHYRSLCSRVSRTARPAGRKSGGRYRIRRPLAALYRRELGRYFSSSVYVTNTAMGLILDIVICAAVLIAPGSLGEMMDTLRTLPVVQQILPLLVAMFVALSCTTCSSISLEGSQFWIVRTAPIRAMDLFRSKILLNLTLTVPVCLICSALLALAFRAPAATTLLLFVVPLIYAVFSAVFGLVVNLKMPRLDWKNEAQVIKQSGAAAVAMFGGMGLTILVLVLLFVFSTHSTLVYLGTTALVLLVTGLLCLWLHRRGEDALARLS